MNTLGGGLIKTDLSANIAIRSKFRNFYAKNLTKGVSIATN